MHASAWREIAFWDGTAPDGAWELLLGAWDKNGARMRVSQSVKLMWFCADRPCADWRITILDVVGPDALYVEADEYAFDIGGDNDPASRIFQSWGATTVLAATGHCPRRRPGSHSIVCERKWNQVSMTVDAGVLLQAADPAPDEKLISLTVCLPAGTELRGIRVEARDANANRPVRTSPRTGLALDVCVDFLDDMMQCVWSPATLDAAMDFYRRNNVRRLHFIYTGGFHDGFYDRRGMQIPGLQERIDQTYARIGEFMPAFFKAAHDHGIQTVAVLKPFETAMGYTVPFDSPEAEAYGRIPSLGGMLWWAMDYTARHPHLRMERNMTDVPVDLGGRRIGRIVLTAERGLPCALDLRKLQLWVSRDNGRYALLDQAVALRHDQGDVCRIVFDGLDLAEHFAAITYAGGERNTFGNNLDQLLEVFDMQGRRLPITIAFSKGRGQRSDFREHGFDMDSAGATCGKNFHWLDAGRPLAFAVGFERYISGALCPAYGEVHDWWMMQVENCIVAGADAVDFRLHHHNRALDWGAYHCNAPVVKAFLDRYGVDIRTQPFDREALRCLQGEFYTNFLRRSRRRLKTAGVAMHAHLEMRMYPPRWPTYMEIRFPWRQWVAEGLLDEITLKSFRTLRSGVPLKAIDWLRSDTGVKINVCPYLNDLVRQPSGPDQLDFLVRDALAAGVDGFTLYENAAVLKGMPGGCIEVMHPWVAAALSSVNEWRRNDATA